MQTYHLPGTTTLPDPLGLMNEFLEVNWYDNLYCNMKIHGYQWYHVPPYLRLHIYHTDEIELTRMFVPSIDVLHDAYSKINLDITSEKKFYDNLMLLVELDQLRQYENKLREQPIIYRHRLYESMLSDLISTRWYERTITDYHYYIHSELEWYLHPPFVFILFFESDLIDLTVIQKPDWKSMKFILDISYANIVDTKSREMHTFLDMIIAQLNLYVMKKTTITSINNATVISENNYSSSHINEKSSSNTVKRKRECEQEYGLMTKTNCHDTTSRTLLNNRVIDLTKPSILNNRLTRQPYAKTQFPINRNTIGN
jgi:hypothetical protein